MNCGSKVEVLFLFVAYSSCIINLTLPNIFIVNDGLLVSRCSNMLHDNGDWCILSCRIGNIWSDDCVSNLLLNEIVCPSMMQQCH